MRYWYAVTSCLFSKWDRVKVACDLKVSVNNTEMSSLPSAIVCTISNWQWFHCSLAIVEHACGFVSFLPVRDWIYVGVLVECPVKYMLTCHCQLETCTLMLYMMIPYVLEMQTLILRLLKFPNIRCSSTSPYMVGWLFVCLFVYQAFLRGKSVIGCTKDP